MAEVKQPVRKTIPEEVMLARLAQSEQMREFFIEMWKQNPALAKQGGARVESLLAPLENPGSAARHQSGISLIELIMFIVIVSVALAGILLVMNVTTKGSADPLIHKQALAIAESLLEEIELMPFTICDPDDATADTGVCTTTPEGLGAETIGGVTEDRYGTASPAVNASFDNVNDYAGATAGADGFTMNSGNGGIRDITNTAIDAVRLSGYSAVVSMTQPGLGTIASADTLLIRVTVTGPDTVPITLEGIRTRYAPRALP